MNLFAFLYEKLMILFLHLFSALALIIFLKLMDIPKGAILLICICWFFIIVITFGYEYIKGKRKYKEMQEKLREIDQKYLIGELLNSPDTMLERIYYDMLKSSLKSMIEEVGRAGDGQQSYKEYIEKWIHEIKTPITAIDLICKNHENEETKRIKKELQGIYYLVEQALYYARSEIVEKDYFVKKLRLFDVVQNAVMANRMSFLDNHIGIAVEETEAMVYTDEKWLSYILNQILNNSIKYRKPHDAKILIYSNTKEGGVELVMEDNGVGISKVELSRIFEKGFTGIQRNNSKSTGIGLYLCKKLCDKLGLSIMAESEKDKYTRITLFFPVGKLTSYDL